MKDSWPLIFSGAVLMIQARIDQVMIKEMINSTEVGYYSAAIRLIEAYGLDTVTSRYWPKDELRARSKYYRRGKFSLLLPFPPYLED